MSFSTQWLWWCSVILLLLRSTEQTPFLFSKTTGTTTSGTVDDHTDLSTVSSTTTETTTTTTGIPKAKTADELGVVECESNYDCVSFGLCRKDSTGKGRCLCPNSCTSVIPMQCDSRRNKIKPCLIMGDSYTKRFNISDPACHSNKCVCPPMFDPVNLNRHPIKNLLPTKCDKRELKVLARAYPSDSVYRGSQVTLFCCINVDPANFIDVSGVTFIQNNSVVREPTRHPFLTELTEYERITTPPCWELEINNAQVSDSGTYTCVASPLSRKFPTVNATLIFQVKEHPTRHHVYVGANQWFKREKKQEKQPRSIKDLRVDANDTSVTINWELQEGPQLKIDLKLYRRVGVGEGQLIRSEEHARSPVVFGGLRPAVAHTLHVTVRDGQTEPFYVQEHFTTSAAKPQSPRSGRVSLGNTLAASWHNMNCEVEWKPPVIDKGRIVKYYLRIRGTLRTSRMDGALVADDFPPAVDKTCANFDEMENPDHSINPVDFSPEFLHCKFGPLKPNRNYTVTMWSENVAGRSEPVVFPDQCLTQYAQPDEVDKPVSTSGENHTLQLSFPVKADDTNGPISCYYVAILPLLSNVSLDSIPPPQEIVVDSYDKALLNNGQTGAALNGERRVYFAYIAESYSDLPPGTTIGDRKMIKGMKQCGVIYLSRYKAEDGPLMTGMKYTGFLIARVDRDSQRNDDGRHTRRPLPPLRPRSHHRTNRDIRMTGPVYAFSGYFKPVLLRSDQDSGVLTMVLMILVPLLFLLMVAAALVFFHSRGVRFLTDVCPIKMSKEETTADRILLKPNHKPIPAEELPSEYLIRHRDSDFMFGQEFEALPSYQYDAIASTKKENTSKNRYNDIRAFDATRVRLSLLPGDDNSDYINANWINGWNGKKRFIAAQAPLDNTIADFWRMVWETDSDLIVMVANLQEKNRCQCSKYWPDEDSSRYGDLLVHPRSTTYFSDYAIREFDVHKISALKKTTSKMSNFGGSAESNLGSEYQNVPSSRNGRIAQTPEPPLLPADSTAVRRIQQYHFTNWNDYRAPECSTGLLRFIHKLRPLDEYKNKPVVIHCSAGVGRTGTFIAIDSMLDQLAEQSKVDVFNFVCEMRKQRNTLVQAPEQYVFIYKALAEYYLFGLTDMDPEQLVEHYMELLTPGISTRSNQSSGMKNALPTRPDQTPANGLEAEFLRLNQTLEAPPKSSFAAKDDNLMKNRFDAAVPFDRNRIVLAPMVGFAEASYINASMIKGYFYPYILAQDPAGETTVFDTWRMLSEQNVTSVVMLSPEEEWSHSEKYWPEEKHRPVHYDMRQHRFTVEMIQEERLHQFVLRRIQYFSKSDPTVRELCQFSFQDWPSDRVVPRSTDPLLGLIAHVLERQCSLPESGPIVLHCRNGSSETGVYCAISLLLERFKAEQRLDVFQTIKGLQTQRPLMFTKIDQYRFVYDAVVDYVQKSKRFFSSSSSS